MRLARAKEKSKISSVPRSKPIARSSAPRKSTSSRQRASSRWSKESNGFGPVSRTILMRSYEHLTNYDGGTYPRCLLRRLWKWKESTGRGHKIAAGHGMLWHRGCGRGCRDCSRCGTRSSVSRPGLRRACAQREEGGRTARAGTGRTSLARVVAANNQSSKTEAGIATKVWATPVEDRVLGESGRKAALERAERELVAAREGLPAAKAALAAAIARQEAERAALKREDRRRELAEALVRLREVHSAAQTASVKATEAEQQLMGARTRLTAARAAHESASAELKDLQLRHSNAGDTLATIRTDLGSKRAEGAGVDTVIADLDTTVRPDLRALAEHEDLTAPKTVEHDLKEAKVKFESLGAPPESYRPSRSCSSRKCCAIQSCSRLTSSASTCGRAKSKSCSRSRTTAGPW